MCPLEDVGHILRGAIKRSRPYVVAEFETHEPIFSRSNKRRLEQRRSQLRIDFTEMLTGPSVHLVHRGQLVIKRGDSHPEDLPDRSGVSARPAMIVEIGLRTSADCVQIFGFQCLLKLLVHEDFSME